MLELSMFLSFFALTCSLCLWIYKLKLDLKLARQTLDIFEEQSETQLRFYMKENAMLSMQVITLTQEVNSKEDNQ